MINFCITMLLFAFSIVSAETVQSIPLNTKAPDFLLKDQHGRTFNLRELEGQLVVIIARNKKGESQNHLWNIKIREKYGDRITILGVADLRSVPFFMKDKIKENFKKYKNSILLDWDGKVADAYGFNENISNIILIDKKGYIRFIYSGNITEKAVDSLFRAINGCYMP